VTRRLLWRVVCVYAAIAALFAVLDPARQAVAHASLLAAVPADGVTIPDPPKTLQLDFNEPVSPLVMRLVDPFGQITTLTNVSATNKSVTIVTPQIVRQGTYALSWRVISADGHPVGGVVRFAVGHPSTGVAAPPVEAGAGVHVAIWAAQLVLAIGLFVGVGGVAFAAWLAAERPMPGRRAFATVMVCGLAAAVMSLPLQGLDALARPLSDVWQPTVWAEGFRTSWGSTVVLALAALTAGLCAFRLHNRSLARWVALLAVAGVGLAFAASGHASTAEPRLLSAPSVFIHAVCVTIWVGSLLPLTRTVRAGDDVALERFSRLIPVPLVLLIATGIVLAAVSLDRLDALWTTDYGLVLSAKLAIVLVLLALAAVNRYALVPRLAINKTQRLVAIIAAEFVLAMVILGIVGLWRFTTPPRALAATETTYIHFHAERAMAQIDLTPERDRGATVSIAVTDDDFRPVAAKEVTLFIWNPSAGIEPIRRDAVFDGGAQWRIGGLHIPVAGVWRMRVEILISDFDKVMIEDNVELPRAP
jgi:copper transport protein